jgi:hypothetical protein
MSGECDDCGEHTTECECVVISPTNETGQITLRGHVGSKWVRCESCNQSWVLVEKNCIRTCSLCEGSK